jgi:predicted alpha/beta hydrolase
VGEPILIQDTTIAARDGFALAATVFTPESAPRAVVLINSATAVPRRLYRGFAACLAERGCAVLTYDYRGTGGSRPRSLRRFPARMRDWAALDAAGAIDHVRAVWAALPLRVVGHSFGGQAVGLVPNNSEIERALLVAAQSGYWRFYLTPLERARVWAMFNLVLPPVARVLGYAPGWLGIGEDLPRGVVLEWRGWCMRKGFFFDDATLDALANFSRYSGPLRAIGIDDDPWATRPAIEALVAHFTGAEVQRVQIEPRRLGVDRIGHFGFFRREHRDTLWRDAADWLENPTQPGS